MMEDSTISVSKVFFSETIVSWYVDSLKSKNGDLNLPLVNY